MLQLVVGFLVAVAIAFRRSRALLVRLSHRATGRVQRSEHSDADTGPPRRHMRLRLPDWIGELRSWIALVRSSSEHKAITFYAESAGYQAYYEGLIDELTRKHRVTITYLTSDRDDPILRREDDRVRAFYLRRLLPFYWAFCRARVLVLTLMDLGSFHLRRSINDVHYAYVFHGIGSTHRACRERAFDHYNSIHCVGPHTSREIRRREELAGLAPKELVSAGYPRLDRIRRLARNRSKRELGRPRLLIAPSWHPDNLVAVCGTELLDAVTNAGFDVVLRAHPETVEREPAVLKRLEEHYGERLRVERSVRTDESLIWADVLITDRSMIALEFAFGTGTPSCGSTDQPRCANPNWRALGLEPLESTLRESLGIVVDPTEVASLPKRITALMADRARWREARIGWRTNTSSSSTSPQRQALDTCWSVPA